MKKSELKQVLKPLIKECIKEAIFEDGVLSGLIKEVVSGLGQPTLVEKAEVSSQDFARQHNIELQQETKKDLDNKRKKLEETLGGRFEGIFENVTPVKAGFPNQKPSGQSPLSGYSPEDPGVNIDGIMSLAGNSWKKMI
tara:strand:- start:450 stop:866 length:417 start_codon:yes stop_codon:yes gene_type:complete